MLEDALFTLVKSTLDAGFSAAGADFAGVTVTQKFQPRQTGLSSGKVVYMEEVLSRRYGSMKRKDVQSGDAFTHTEIQIWETTLQISAAHTRNPSALSPVAAMDLAKRASAILQGDAGLAALAAGGIRPLRVTDIRKIPFVNDADQWETMPTFDIVLTYADSIVSATPAATIEQNVKGV